MREFKGPSKQRGFVPLLGATMGPLAGKVISGLGGLLGGKSQIDSLNDARNDIKGLPGMSGPQNVSGNFGTSAGGVFNLDPGLAALQTMQQQGGGLMGGGLFNDPRLQAALGQNDIAGALGQSNQALGVQQGGQAFGGLGALFQQQQGLAGQFAGATAAGPQDFFGGAGAQLRSAGLQQQLTGGDQAGLQSQELAAMRSAAQPFQDRQFNQMQNRLHSMGMLGSTGGGQQLEGLFNSFGQQDLDFQQEAFNRGAQRSQLMSEQGGQMFGQGAQALGQNLGQFNQGAQFANMFGQGAAGIEGQSFGQQLGANQFNTSQGMNRVNQAMGLFGQGADIFGQQFGLGLQSAAGALDFGRFGLDAAAMPSQLQAQLLDASGQHSAALGGLGSQRGSATSGFLGGVGRALGSIFSDERLKDNLIRLGSIGELGWYEWVWNDKAKEIGADDQPNYGVIAQEVAELYPQAVSTKQGYLQVDYNIILGV